MTINADFKIVIF